MRIPILSFVLVALFGSSSWIGTNSIWVQLSLLTSVLPEGWKLPSFLDAVVEIACIAPLIYTILHKCFKNLKIPQVPLIIIFLTIACICQLSLCFFWNKHSRIFGQDRSWPLYLHVFGLAIVDAMSSVLFIPFMAKFHPANLNAYFVGMGLSALIPSLLSLIQGTSNYECDPNGVPHYFPPKFSVSVFFFIIFCFTVVALCSFIILYKMGAHKHANTIISASSSKNIPENGDLDYITGPKYALFLFMTALVNAQMNGVIPSVQSYASLPYSQATYHYGVTLANVVAPLASFLPFFVRIRNPKILGILTICSSLVTAFIVYLGAISPKLIFDSRSWGSVLSIGSSIVAAGLHSYLRTNFASILRDGHQKESRLFWCGVFIQIGSFVGSAIMFPLVNIFNVFTPSSPC